MNTGGLDGGVSTLSNSTAIMTTRLLLVAQPINTAGHVSSFPFHCSFNSEAPVGSNVNHHCKAERACGDSIVSYNAKQEEQICKLTTPAPVCFWALHGQNERENTRNRQVHKLF